MAVLTLSTWKTSTCPTATPQAGFACPDLTLSCRLDELGLEAIGQRLEQDGAVLACRVVEPDRWCRRCGCEGTRAALSTWGVYQRVIAAYRPADRRRGASWCSP
jgi:hypothetical protein